MTGGKSRIGACGAACIALAVVGIPMGLAGCEQSGDAAPEVATVAEPLASPAVHRDAAVPQTETARSTAPQTDATRSTVPPTVPARVPISRPSVQVEFDPPVLDMGLVLPNTAARGTIQIRNIGKEHARILTVKPSCKCTTIEDLTGKVIAPGESIPLEAELEPQAITGRKTATIDVLFEGMSEPYKVDLLAEISMPIRVSPGILNLATGDTSGHIVVESIDGRPFNILSANRKPPVFVGYEPDLDEPKSSYVLKWDLADEVASRQLEPWWIIETDYPDSPLADVWVRHRSTIDLSIRNRPWQVPSRRTNLGYMDKDTPREFTVDVVKIGPNNAIYAVRSLSGDFTAELVNFERKGNDAVCTVRVTPKKGFTGLLYGPMEMIASAHSHTQYVIGKVR